MISFNLFLEEKQIDIIKKEAQHVNSFHKWVINNTHKKEFKFKHKNWDWDLPNDPCLTGHCAMAAINLVHRLKKRGINAKFVVGEVNGGDHAWVEHKGRIIDPTAAQFGKPDIHITTYKNDKDYTKLLTGFRALRDIKYWPTSQSYPKSARNLLRTQYQEYIKNV